MTPFTRKNFPQALPMVEDFRAVFGDAVQTTYARDGDIERGTPWERACACGAPAVAAIGLKWRCVNCIYGEDARDKEY